LFSFGNGAFGKLGHGDTNHRISPTRIDIGVRFRAISCGDYHCIAISEERIEGAGSQSPLMRALTRKKSSRTRMMPRNTVM